jgi:acetyltransferase-like isoleucine patch superfamily enzyme
MKILKKYLLTSLLMVMPSRIKLWILALCGNSFGRGCYIGFSFIEAENIVLGDHVYIGHFNIVKSLKRLHMESGSRISLMNWITGGNTGSFSLGRNSSVSVGHYFDASGDIIIGKNCIIAGRHSQFFSHGITPSILNQRKEIVIGDWCYIGSAVKWVPGAFVSDHTFVGMGAVISKGFLENYVLIAGNPATVRRKLGEGDSYFKRDHMPHAHHPESYLG